MSHVQHITHFRETDSVAATALLAPHKRPLATREKSTNALGQIKPVTIELDEVMFTGRVPVSTWTFVFSIHSKLWVSRLTTLYFGKRQGLSRPIYRDKLYVPDHRLDLQIGITAYNNYGDVLSAAHALRCYSINNMRNTSHLIRLDEDWTQLLFNLSVQIGN